MTQSEKSVTKKYVIAIGATVLFSIMLGLSLLDTIEIKKSFKLGNSLACKTTENSGKIIKKGDWEVSGNIFINAEKGIFFYVSSCEVAEK